MIEIIDKENFEEILPLIVAYLEFYKVQYQDINIYREHFSQFFGATSEESQFGYRKDGQMVGFATVYFSHVTSIAGKVCVMNDLFTADKHRGEGVGRKLIDHCKAYAKEKGAKRLQSSTAPDNLTAIKLYDSICTSKSNWDFYVWNI